jgi:hypothetical protein
MTITTSCANTRSVKLRRFDRDYVSWPVTGMQANATAYVELESDGTWHPLVVGVDEVTGYFAGPGFANPGTAIVLAGVVHCEIRIVTGGVTSVTLDGGFIEIVP